MCVCGGAGREKESMEHKQTFKGRLETRKACVCCVLETSGFETTTIPNLHFAFLDSLL